jgi:hypothetical protein
MTHLTADELVDAVDGRLSQVLQTHLAGCDGCREKLADLAGVLAEVRAVDVPEPSPLFWERLSDNVRSAVAADSARPPIVARWFEWPVLVPLGALALLVFALVSVVPQGAHDLWRTQLAMSTGVDADDVGTALDADTHWELMAALIGDVDVEAAEQAGMSAVPGSADDVVSHLSSAEQQELGRLLREELKSSGG